MIEQGSDLEVRQRLQQHAKPLALQRFASALAEWAGLPRKGSAQVTVIGEAKCTSQPRTPSDLARLAHIRDLMGARAKDAALVPFGRSGFTGELHQARAAGEVTLVTLADMYHRDG